jgi:hypothetical protein
MTRQKRKEIEANKEMNKEVKQGHFKKNKNQR